MSIIQKSQKALEYDKILTVLANYAKTEQSKKLCLELTPFVRIEDIKEQLVMTREAKDVLDMAMDIPVEKIPNFKKLKEQNDEITQARRSQVGSGDRSEKIRTYNYQQGRITDHRIGMSIYQMEDFLNGNLDEMINALIAADRAQRLKGE